jgi:threonine/homoserine/homoserine lactone efflux protein
MRASRLPLSVLVLASRYGWRQIVAFQAGIVLVYALVAFGMAGTATQLGDFFQAAAGAVQLAGSLLILTLGIRLLLSTGKAVPAGPAPSFQAGALLQLLNPKYPAVVLTVLAARADARPLAVAGVVVAVGTVGLAFYACAGWAVCRPWVNTCGA